jgi:ring-1,2-phenylacetyl-CoA epoxidase subunit PaaB
MPGHYEVFRREKHAEPLEHAGSVEAPDDALAVIYARQVFGRRGESETLWVVPRDQVIVTPGPAPSFDRSYRRVDGYSIKAKLRAAREAAGTQREDR